jgi:IS30 family transposase
MKKSTDYHDYVFREGKLVGEFEEINNRPRKGLGVRSPLAVYTELLLNSPQHSTLTH